MKPFIISSYLKIKEGLETGQSIQIGSDLLNTFDACLLEKRLKESFCCYDMRLCIENYKKIKVNGNTVRFSGSVINYCPFCGGKIEK